MLGTSGDRSTLCSRRNRISVVLAETDMAMTREEILSVVGPADEVLLADIMATGASLEDLREAWGWLNGDEALMSEGRPLPGTRVAELIDLLEPEAPED